MNSKTSQEILESQQFYPYIEKWRKIIFSTNSVNEIKAKKIIKNAYNLINLKEPEIIFFSSPRDAKNWFIKNNETYYLSNYRCLKKELIKLLRKEFEKPYNQKLYSQYLDLDNIFYIEQCLFRDACDLIYDLIYQAYDNTGNVWYKVTADGELIHNNCCAEDFLIDKLKISCELSIWNTLKSLVEECPYIFAFTDICIVIEKPNKIYLDRNHLVHKEGAPAISYKDGYSIYAYHGIKIPQKYGEYTLAQWQPQWILEEKDELIREALVRGIGFDKFDRLLPEKKNIYWQNYRDLICNASARLNDRFQVHYSQNLDLLCSKINSDAIEELFHNLPFKLPQELRCSYEYFDYFLQIIPDVTINSLEKALAEFKFNDCLKSKNISENTYVFLLFKGNKQDYYYILCDRESQEFSEIWYVKERSQPVVFAPNLTSLILAIAECYDTGAYYILVKDKVQELHYYIEQNLTKVATIFQKYQILNIY